MNQWTWVIRLSWLFHSDDFLFFHKRGVCDIAFSKNYNQRSRHLQRFQEVLHGKTHASWKAGIFDNRRGSSHNMALLWIYCTSQERPRFSCISELSSFISRRSAVRLCSLIVSWLWLFRLSTQDQTTQMLQTVSWWTFCSVWWSLTSHRSQMAE